MPESSERRVVAVAAAALTAAALILTGGMAASAAPGGRSAASGSFPDAKPSWATRANDQGRAPKTKTVEGEIVFALRDRTGATQIAQAVSTPGSALYGKYLTPTEWIDRFSPRKTVFDEALHYLERNHLTITGTPRSRLFIAFRGTVDQFDGLFKTELKQYHHDGKVVIAPASAPSLPDSLSSAVSGVYLGTARPIARPQVARDAAEADPVSVDGYRCSKYWQQHTVTLPEAYGQTEFPTANCGYLGKQYRSLYGASKSMTGKGQTVADLLWYGSPTPVKDFATFVRRNGGTPLTSSTYRQIVAKKFYDVKFCGGIGGVQEEQVLDVTAIHGIAPKARILYVGAYNCTSGLDVALSRILDDHLATIVSNSYGDIGELPAAVVQVNENQFMQAAAEGVGLAFSSGDQGDETPDLPAASASYPASSPWVTAVGGTTTEIARNGSAALQTGWGNHYDAVVKDPATGEPVYEADPPGAFQSGSGGGTSAVFARPWYQDGVVGTEGRGVPDVAAVGDPRTGELIGFRPYDDETKRSLPYTEEILAGTSLSSPLFAAEVALLQQKTHRTFGFINPLVYAASAAGAPALRDVLPADVAVGYNDQFDGHTSLVTGNQDTSLTVGTGWDDVTGLGVLQLDALGTSMR